MDAGWRGGVGCSPVCLDLCVGLSPSPVRELSPARHELLDRPAGCGDSKAKILEAKVTQMSEENRRLTEMIARLYGSHIAQLGLDGAGSPSPPPRPVSPLAGKKRGRESMETANSCDANSNRQRSGATADADADHAESFATDDGLCRRIKVSRVCRRIDPSDTTLVVKDGYQWRKYGQKVQRSAEDSSLLVATYEGEHNHPHPSSRAGELPAAAGTGGSLPCSISINSSGPTITLDLTKNGGAVQLVEAAEGATHPPPPDLKEVCREVASPEFRTALVEQMASALTSDPKFTGALAAAILQKLPEL
ncbi:hypothetical protein E2562_008320 [Oryza meyeriana var. granulata]|uniref:WRKY domain-containing protein n=1 Tax=Oryza meyeriana var. granulata TaxID=110450 RepID=A0A6G1DG25_9ORYZ|nr:hypothetical protein E2562_008320 [Oryza meyeriana var. granulata]